MEHQENHTLKKQSKKHPWPLLIFAIVFLGASGYWVYAFPPDFSIAVATLRIPLLIPFFTILGLGLYSLSSYIFISALQGLVIASTIVLYLLLRLFGFSHPLFGLLLLAIFICIEFVFWKKR